MSLHEAADLLHGTLQAGHVLPVAPDEVLSPQVDSEVGAAECRAQLDLQKTGRRGKDAESSPGCLGTRGTNTSSEISLGPESHTDSPGGNESLDKKTMKESIITNTLSE